MPEEEGMGTEGIKEADGDAVKFKVALSVAREASTQTELEEVVAEPSL